MVRNFFVITVYLSILIEASSCRPYRSAYSFNFGLIFFNKVYSPFYHLYSATYCTLIYSKHYMLKRLLLLGFSMIINPVPFSSTKKQKNRSSLFQKKYLIYLFAFSFGFQSNSKISNFILISLT